MQRRRHGVHVQCSSNSRTWLISILEKSEHSIFFLYIIVLLSFFVEERFGECACYPLELVLKCKLTSLVREVKQLRIFLKKEWVHIPEVFGTVGNSFLLTFDECTCYTLPTNRPSNDHARRSRPIQSSSLIIDRPAQSSAPHGALIRDGWANCRCTDGDPSERK